MENINILRIETKLGELFSEKIDLSDYTGTDNKMAFNTRAIAALALAMKCGLNYDQAAKNITDGYHDLGIDALYLDNTQKKLFVVQSKWRASGNGSISQEEMSTFVEGVKRLINFDLDGANQKILSKKADIDFGISQIGYQIHLIFAHTGNSYISNYVRRPLERLMDSTNDDISTLLVFDELTFREIYAYLATGQNSKSIDLDDVILTNWGKYDSPYSVYYGIISAAAVGEWFIHYGNSLFAQNIRYYKGNTEVNEGIKRVLLNEPEKFFYYNNGIKLLCKKIERKAKGSTTNSTGLFSLFGVSLVNGAQTTGVIGNVYSQNPEQIAKANVMIQIIDLSNAEDDAATQITKLSNTQNRIDSKDFVSLDQEQDRLRMEMSFSHITYLYKDGDILTDPETQITIDEAIVALACCQKDISLAILAKRNIGALTEDINRPPYKVLFNSGTNSFVLINSVKTVRKIEAYLQIKKEQLSGRERLVCVHANRFIEHCILQVLMDNQNFSQTVLDGQYFDEKISPLIEDLLPKVIASMNICYPESYPANIFKNTGKCKEIYNKIPQTVDVL